MRTNIEKATIINNIFGTVTYPFIFLFSLLLMAFIGAPFWLLCFWALMHLLQAGHWIASLVLRWFLYQKEQQKPTTEFGCADCRHVSGNHGDGKCSVSGCKCTGFVEQD